MTIPVDNNIRLELLEPGHAQPIFDLVDNNREHLRQWLPWVDRMKSVDFIQSYIEGSQQRNKDGVEHGFVIIQNDMVVGRIGINRIDSINKIGEIGYWIGQEQQGKGIMTNSCRSLIKFGFGELGLNRIEIKCGTGNIKSQAIPERLKFSKEGILRQAELLYDRYIDLYLYSMCKSDYP